MKELTERQRELMATEIMQCTRIIRRVANKLDGKDAEHLNNVITHLAKAVLIIDDNPFDVSKCLRAGDL